MYYLIVFESTHIAISTKKKLTAQLPVRTIPTLREISASCGISLRVEAEYKDQLIEFFKATNIDSSKYSVYVINMSKDEKNVRNFEKMNVI